MPPLGGKKRMVLLYFIVLKSVINNTNKMMDSGVVCRKTIFIEYLQYTLF